MGPVDAYGYPSPSHLFGLAQTTGLKWWILAVLLKKWWILAVLLKKSDQNEGVHVPG